MFEISQIVILFFFCLSLLLLVSRKGIQNVLATVFSVFICLQGFSLYFGGSLIDLKFYKHLSFNDISISFSFLWKESIFLVIFVILLVYVFSFLHKKLFNKTKRVYLIVIVVITFIVMSFPKGVLNNIYQIIKLNSVNDKSLDVSLKDLNIDPTDYVYSNAIKATPGKNIIIISLESFEQGFLQDNFKNLTPNLRQFKKDYNYFDMNQGNGSSWTAGSMYTYLTGFPMFFKGLGNEIFQNTVDAKLTGISHVLDEAGYNQLYLLGNPDFSGMSDLLNTYKIENFPQSYYDEKYGKASFGLHDYDLFKEAKEQVLNLKSKSDPFALYMSTISTHFPNGFYDERMSKNISEKESELEFMVAAVDYMLNDFIKFLETQGLLESTVFYIFPDHLMMGGSSRVIDKMKERKLFLLTNSKKEKLTSINNKTLIEQIDLPKLILEGAEIKHNAKFLTDFIVGDKKEFIENNVEELLALSEASIRIDGFNENFQISLKSFSDTLKSNTIKLKSSHKPLTFETDNFSIKKYRYHVFIFDRHMRVSHKKSNRENLIYRSFNNQENILLDIVDSTHMNMFIRKGNAISRARQFSQTEIEILKEDFDELKLIEAYGFESKKMVDHNYFKINNPGGTLFLTSSFESNQTSVRLDDKILNHKKGLNLIVLNNPSQIENFNIHNGDKIMELFISRIKNLIETNTNFVIFADNMVSIKSDNLRNELIELKLSKLAQIKYNQPYICYSESGVNIENVNSNSLSIQVNINNDQSDQFKSKLGRIKNETERFIAHAGGAIEGLSYTNSLEALDVSYAKGFRLFELDIIKTSDNQFVAAHDWKRWRRNNGFDDDEPISLNTFMETKIQGKYSPLSMKEINNWFSKHKDAILVTDKINTPKVFASEFIDKQRLMMELFSKNAVKEAKANGIKFMAASKVFRGMNNQNKLKFISENQVKYMTISRRSIHNNIAFYKKLKNQGVKLYAFNINFDPWINEQYVILNEMDYIYGFYADNWFD